MAKASLKSQIRSALRRLWLWSDLRRDALGRARVSRGVYRCHYCKGLVGPKMIDIDHIIPATPKGGINVPTDWGIFIERLLFCDPSNLVGACKECHKAKTKEERAKKLRKKLLTKKGKKK